MNKFEEFNASVLVKQGTLLKKYEWLIKYLKENPTCNIYLSSQDFEEGTLIYSTSNLDGRNYNITPDDIVLFKNGYIAVIDSIGETSFVIRNQFIFQGPQGPQGIQGIQGETGETGPENLFVTTIKSFSPTGNYVNIEFSDYNRNPKVNEKFYCVTTYNDVTYLVLMQVNGIDESTLKANCRKLSNRQITGPQGPQGNPGPTVYKHNLSLTASEGIFQTSLYSSLNRDLTLTDLEGLKLCGCALAKMNGGELFIPNFHYNAIVNDILEVTGSDGTSHTSLHISAIGVQERVEI